MFPKIKTIQRLLVAKRDFIFMNVCIINKNRGIRGFKLIWRKEQNGYKYCDYKYNESN